MLKLLFLATAAAAAAVTAAKASSAAVSTTKKCGNAEFMPPVEAPTWNRPDTDEQTAREYGMDYVCVQLKVESGKLKVIHVN